MQRRIEQANRHRVACHCPEDPFKIFSLDRQQRLQRLFAFSIAVGQDHPTHKGQPLFPHKHMLCPAEADPFRPQLQSAACICGGVGIGPHAQSPAFIGPGEQLAQLRGGPGIDQGRLPRDHLSRSPVNGEESPFGIFFSLNRYPASFEIDLQRLTAADAGFARSPSDNRGMAGHAAPASEDPLGGIDPVNIIGSGLGADQKHLLTGPRPLLGPVSIEDYLARSRPRGGRQPPGNGVESGAGFKARMQQLIEPGGVNAPQRIRPADLPFFDQINRYLYSRCRRPLAAAGLQKIELPLFNGELDILHIAVVLFQPAAQTDELAVNFRQGAAELFEGTGCADAGDNILALSIQQIFAVDPFFTISGAAGKSNPGAAVIAQVSVNHGLHGHSCAEMIRNSVRPPVNKRPRCIP